ncbi:hypothetical protein PsorP6_006166 [Peronosclerospora sorghi]|uniref:Uncharacterized protein n=1 Tax=Peronosclerospora sorghi TaxID=230839 RepID=A0ACC0W166_9STRA|nr:hypothetical protein PsorP6_006166 [Peronosclerospora sorghi]
MAMAFRSRSRIQSLASVNYAYVVLDEAHLIRNPTTAVFQAVRKLHASHRIALIGTPSQNNVTDLWALFEFLMPGLAFSFPTNQRSGAEGASSEDHLEYSFTPIFTAEAPLCTRLVKREHTNKYSGKTWGRTWGDKAVDECVNESPATAKICVHPSLAVDDAISRALSATEKTLLIWKCSGKLTGLRDLLVECCDVAVWDRGASRGDASDTDDFDDTNFSPHRCLVFAHLQQPIDLTEQMLKDALPGPIDQAHRIVQKQTVCVFRLIMEETLEEHILNLQEYKEKVASTVVKKIDASTGISSNTNDILN